MENKDKYYIYGTTVIKGCFQNVYLKKDGKLSTDVEKNDLMLFETSKKAFEFTEEKGWDFADWTKICNF